MHALPFTLKRAHFASLKLLRQFTVPLQLTPARFDVLYVLHKSRYRRPFQYWIAKSLGVSRPTVCKMVHALAKLGIIELSVDSKNAHFRRIAITRVGRKLFARAFKAIRRRRVEAAVRYAWSSTDLSRKEMTQTICEIVIGVLRYCRGLNEHTELYRYD